MGAVVSNPFVEEQIEPILNRIGAPIAVYGFFLNNRVLGLWVWVFGRRSKPLEKDWRISKETRYIKNLEETTRKELDNFQNKEQAALKRPKNFERELENKEQTARKEPENYKARSKPLEKD